MEKAQRICLPHPSQTSSGAISLSVYNGLLVVVGVLFHACIIFSIFDIYFKSPVVHGIQPVALSTSKPPADRVVFFVADGLRADKLFEADNSYGVEGRLHFFKSLGLTPSQIDKECSNTLRNPTRAPFLRCVIENKGSWGVSHTRVPTESRPGHVAIFAGMYEDVSAVTRGWTANPVPYDSVFNQSNHAWLFGSPDIVPMFSHYSHVEELHYSSDEEDFGAADATSLDTWVFRKVQEMFDDAKRNATLDSLLRQPKVVIFLHLLGIDSNGHAHRPHSREYLENIALVDEGVRHISEIVNNFYQDSKTAYILTADHGMSAKGSHGDGDPTNTRTPLVAWGAGIRTPERISTQLKAEDTIEISGPSAELVKQQFDETSEGVVSRTWKLEDFRRKDVMQADISPLIASLIGIGMPLNSVGALPLAYLSKGEHRARSIAANAKQLFYQVVRKSLLKEISTLWFRAFEPLAELDRKMRVVDDALAREEYEIAESLSHDVIKLSWSGLEYFQKYDWVFLMATVTLGYLGWIALLSVILTRSPSELLLFYEVDIRKNLVKPLAFALACAAIALYVEHSPLTYYGYTFFAILFWMAALCDWNSSRVLVRILSSAIHRRESLLGMLVLLFCLEILVVGFQDRETFALLFLLIGSWPWVWKTGNAFVPSLPWTAHMSLRASWSCICLVIAIFPLLPTDCGEYSSLVVLGVATLIIAGLFGLQARSRLFFLQYLLIAMAGILVYLTDLSLSKRQGLPLPLQILNWSVSIIAAMLPLVYPTLSVNPSTSIVSKATEGMHLADNQRQILRLASISLGWAPFYTLMSISYEVLFYTALAAAMLLWFCLEIDCAVTKRQKLSAAEQECEGKSLARNVQWLDEARMGLFFMAFTNIAFFGTGNIASMSSFEISSTYRFWTGFAPFLMGALLIGKILIPIASVTAAFGLINQELGLTPFRLFLLVLALSDILSINFFFLVRDEGSWKEIGNSISKFGIVNAQIVFIPIMFLLTRRYIRPTFKAHFTSDAIKRRKEQ